MLGMELPPSPVSDVDERSPTAPVSRLQLMQARFQSKLLREKERKMLQLYPEAGHAHAAAAGGNGGSVRQFFAQRRALQASGSGGAAAASLNGLQQSLNGSWSSGTFARHPPKHGSPVGWDKSYPLSPLDRDARDSGPYLGSFSTKNGLDRSRPKPTPPPPAAPNRRRLEAPAARKPSRRAPSLDRRNAAAAADQGMRRSNSQILAAPSSHHREKENEPRAPLAAKTPPQRSQNKSEAARVANGSRRLGPTATSPTAATKAPVPTKDQRDDGEPRAVSPPKAKKAPVPAISYHSPPKPSSPAAPKQAGRTPPPRRPPAVAVDPNLVACPFCDRHFALDRIDKHKDICQKTTTKKRKVFDPTKMRMKGTDLEEFARKSAKSGHRSPNPPSPKKGDWRQKRNAFIETIRQAKAVQRHVAAGGKASDLPPPPPMDTSDYVLCPHCGRKFSEAAAERHIPKCKNIKSNKKAAY